MRPRDDHQLMRALATGDRQALQTLYDRHAEFIFRVAYRFLVNEEDARDLTQSVFVNLMQSAHRYKPNAKLTTWIYRIAVNGCLNYQSNADYRFRSSCDGNDILTRIAAPQESQPDYRIEQTRQKMQLQKALLRLPERQRIALLLKYYEEMSYKEIAEVLDCSKNSVESLLFRAKQALRNFLRGSC